MPRRKGPLPTREFDDPGSLLTTTRQLIKDDERTMLIIAQMSGIPFFWLKKFTAGEIRNPSVNRVQYMYELLTKKELIK